MAKVNKTESSTRKRRELKERAGRTYYAQSKDGNTLYRFGSHGERLVAIKESKGKMLQIGALDFRNAIAEDVKGLLMVIDARETSTPAKVPIAAVEQGTISAESIAMAVAQALAPLLKNQVQAQATQVPGEQPNASRLAANH